MSAIPGSLAPATDTLLAQYVMPGQMFVAKVPTRFTTILGSCVSVCLYDPGAGIGGINHFLLPGAPGRDEKEPLRWGIPAIDALFAQVLEAGAHKAKLQAKVFGGAQIGGRNVPEALRIGARNIDTALAELKRLHIPIVNQSLGGDAGRKIVFESHTGMVWAKQLGSAKPDSG